MEDALVSFCLGCQPSSSYISPHAHTHTHTHTHTPVSPILEISILFNTFHIPVCIYLALVFAASLVAQRVKCLPAMRETWVQSLGGEDPLEKEMATHSSILAWKTPWMEKPSGLQSQRVGHD